MAKASKSVAIKAPTGKGAGTKSPPGGYAVAAKSTPAAKRKTTTRGATNKGSGNAAKPKNGRVKKANASRQMIRKPSPTRAGQIPGVTTRGY